MSVIEQKSSSHFEVIATVESAVGARTGLWYPSRDRCVDPVMVVVVVVAVIEVCVCGGFGAMVLCCPDTPPSDPACRLYVAAPEAQGKGSRLLVYEPC